VSVLTTDEMVASLEPADTMLNGVGHLSVATPRGWEPLYDGMRFDSPPTLQIYIVMLR